MMPPIPYVAPLGDAANDDVRVCLAGGGRRYRVLAPDEQVRALRLMTELTELLESDGEAIDALDAAFGKPRRRPCAWVVVPMLSVELVQAHRSAPRRGRR